APVVRLWTAARVVDRDGARRRVMSAVHDAAGLDDDGVDGRAAVEREVRARLDDEIVRPPAGAAAASTSPSCPVRVTTGDVAGLHGRTGAGPRDRDGRDGGGHEKERDDHENSPGHGPSLDDRVRISRI